MNFNDLVIDIKNALVYDGYVLDIKVYRASGDVVCDLCGKKYYDHPMDMENLSWDNYPYLHILCNLDRVHL